MGERVFITGAMGFIGSNLISELLSKGYRVIALIRRAPRKYLYHNNLKIIEGDILDKEYLSEVLRDIDTLFHTAAFISFALKDFHKSYKVNVIGTKNVLEVAWRNGVKKVIHLSAASVLGYTNNPKDIIDEERKFNVSKKNSYTYTKKLAEDLVMDYASKGLDVSIANIATVYGQGDRKMNSGTIIKSIYHNEVKFSPPGGTSYVSMKDLVKGLIMLSEKGKRGERYIFCTENLSYFELLNRIADCLRRNPIKCILPQWTYFPVWGVFLLKDFFLRNAADKVNILTAEIIKESYFYKYYSSNKAKKELGWQPKISLEEAVKEALNFYLKEGLI
jgi:dihydroflavonol-4-reductase